MFIFLLLDFFFEGNNAKYALQLNMGMEKKTRQKEVGS